MDIAFDRFDSARLLNMGCLAKKRESFANFRDRQNVECYQRQMAWCQYQTVRIRKDVLHWKKTFISNSKAECTTYSAHFLLISWFMF